MFRRNGMGTFSILTTVGIGIGLGMAASRMMRNGGIQLTELMSSNQKQHSQHKNQQHH